MKNKLISNSIIFTGMTVIQKSMAFLLLPIYTRVLSPNEYGISNLVTSVFSIYMLLFSFALDDTVARYYHEFKNDIKMRKVVLGTFSIISTLINVIGVMLILVARHVMIIPLAPNIEFYPYLLLGIVPLLCSSLYSIFQKLLIIEEKAMHYSINTLSFFLINTVLSIIFIVYLRMGALGVLSASAITYCIYFVYSIIYLLPRIDIKIDKQLAVSGLKYGGVLLPNRVASWGLGSFSKVFLGGSISASALGVFNIGLTFSSLLTILSNSFSLAFQPWIYKQLDNESKNKDNIKLLINSVSIIYGVIGFGISLFARDVISFFIDIRYADAIKIVPLLILGTSFAAYSTLFVYILFYYRDSTRYIASSTIVGAILNILLSVILIPKYSIGGAAIAIVISNFVIFLIKSYVAMNRINFNVNLFWLILITVTYYLIATLLSSYQVLIKILVYIIVISIVYFINRKSLSVFIKRIIKI